MAETTFFVNSTTVVTAVLIVLATLVVALRFYARRLVKLPLLADDWTILVALILSWACGVIYWIYTKRSHTHLNDDDIFLALEDIAEFTSVSQIFSYALIGIVKISVLLFYKRIFATPRFRLAMWIMIGFVSLWTVAIVIVALFWNQKIFKTFASAGVPTAIDGPLFGVVVASMSMAFDVIIVAFPLIRISRLRMPLRQKIAVGLIFALGIFCCIAAAVRFALLYQAVQGWTLGFDLDLFIPAQILATLEFNIAIIAASLPSLKVFLNSDGPLRKRTRTWSAKMHTYFSSSDPQSARSTQNAEVSGKGKFNSLDQSALESTNYDGRDMEANGGGEVTELRTWFRDASDSELLTGLRPQHSKVVVGCQSTPSRESAEAPQAITVTQTIETRYDEKRNLTCF